MVRTSSAFLIVTVFLVGAVTTSSSGSPLLPHEADPAGPLRTESHPHVYTPGWSAPMGYQGPQNDEEPTGVQPIEFIFGGSIKKTFTRVGVIPPMHGDLTNPFHGPSVLDYLDATLRGMHGWVEVMNRFADDYPEYAYLRDIEVQVELLDGEVPTVLGYDVIVAYVHSANAFRGVASGPGGTQGFIDVVGLGDQVHYANRYIALSLFASAPRAGQTLMDFPEYNDLWTVTMHEFAHTFGLGHTQTWTEEEGPDLMNSPYALIYGDGDPTGDGGERSHLLCITSLNLYGMGHLYRWIPSGEWEGSSGFLESPLPYEWYCPDGHQPPSFKEDLAAGKTEFLFSNKR